MKRQWKNQSNAERHYTGKFYRPMMNMENPVDSFAVGRIWVRIFPTGAGPIYRFRADFRFRYPNGHQTEYFPDDSLRELLRAVRKTRRTVRRLERNQHLPLPLRMIRYALGL